MSRSFLFLLLIHFYHKILTEYIFMIKGEYYDYIQNDKFNKRKILLENERQPSFKPRYDQEQPKPKKDNDLTF